MTVSERCSSLPRAARLPGLAVAAVGLVAALAPPPALAQSMLAAQGLGVLVEPLDARARALGSAGVGLPGWHLLLTDPSSSGGIAMPTVSASLQHSAGTLTDGQEVGHARFPQAAVSYPFRGSVFSVQMGSGFDQEWEARHEHTVELAGEVVDAEDHFESLGSVGQVRLGWARRLVQSVAVGVSTGTYVGTVERRFTRFLDPGQIGVDVEPFRTRGRWRASGLLVGAGVTWDPSGLLRLAGSATWSRPLRFSPVDGPDAERVRHSMPLDLRGGGTFVLTPGVHLVLGVSFADWSRTGETLAEGTTRSGAWSYGGGLELARGTIRERPIHLRLGARQRELPFHFQGEPASERTFSGGIGANLADTDVMPDGRVELSLERGSRSGGELSEDFLRTTLTIRLGGG